LNRPALLRHGSRRPSLLHHDARRPHPLRSPPCVRGGVATAHSLADEGARGRLWPLARLGWLSWRTKMAATTAAVVAEEDTELRDLLVQTLENSGVLNRIKAELRAAVFLALEEQEKVENKTPLINESLKKFLNTKDGRLVASLVAEFLQFFNLDFTLAVFHPETSTLQGLEGRENLARDLGIIEAEGTVGGPLLLEVIRRCQQKEKGPTSGEGALDLSDGHPPSKSPEGKTSVNSTPSKIPRYKGQGKKKTSGQKSGDKKTSSETSQSETSVSLSEPKSKSSLHSLAHETRIASFLNSSTLDAKDKNALCPDEDDAEDSFFDDPIPKPEKTYGWRSEPRKQVGSLASLSDIPPLRSGLSSLAGAPSLTDAAESEYAGKRGSTVLKELKLLFFRILFIFPLL
ncbi:Centrosomal protein 43, partial [Lemmus lemmus]